MTTAANEGGVSLTYELSGCNGRVLLRAELPDGTFYTDKIDVTSEKGRLQFIEGLLQKQAGLPRAEIERELLRIAGELTRPPDGDGGDGQAPDAKQKDLLIAIGTEPGKVELFHTPGRHDAEAFATLSIDDHRETWPLGSKAFRRWVEYQFHSRYHEVPGSQALNDALNTLSGIAIYGEAVHEIAVRFALHAGAIWLDLGDETYQAVRITAEGWALVPSSEVPVRFIRRRGMRAIPAPVQGGSLDELRPLVNLPDETAWKLFVACMVAYVRPRGPYPILVVGGEQGSAKSTLSKILRLLLDPNEVSLRRPPRDDRDLMIGAKNNWILAYDNLSGLTPSLSDSLCSLATEGGFGTRQLYTDDEEQLFNAMRPIVLNGIGEIAERPDLLDRSVVLTLPTIREDARRDEAELWGTFEQLRPRLLGALLSAVSVALRRWEQVKMPIKPRMADFAIWVTAAEPGLGWETGSFMAAYQGNREDAILMAIEASAIGPVLMGFMDGRSAWECTAKDLLEKLGQAADEKTRQRRDWPKTPRALREALTRITPNLRAMGIKVTFEKKGRAGDRRRMILLETVWVQPSPPSTRSPVAATTPAGGQSSGRTGDGPREEAGEDRPHADAHDDLRQAKLDGGDCGDGPPPTSAPGQRAREQTQPPGQNAGDDDVLEL